MTAESIESSPSNVEQENPTEVGVRSRFISNFPANCESESPRTLPRTTSRRITSPTNRAPAIWTPSDGIALRNGSRISKVRRNAPRSCRRGSSNRPGACSAQSFCVPKRTSKLATRPWQILRQAHFSGSLHSAGSAAVKLQACGPSTVETNPQESVPPRRRPLRSALAGQLGHMLSSPCPILLCEPYLLLSQAAAVRLTTRRDAKRHGIVRLAAGCCCRLSISARKATTPPRHMHR